VEYIYGTDGDKQILKTVGPAHTNFTGFVVTSREVDGVSTIDKCKIVEHYKSDEDEEGNCYDWYEVTARDHYEDRTVAAAEDDDAIAELSQIIMDQEEAIAELSELVSGLVEGGK
jgi:hypothetical protein